MKAAKDAEIHTLKVTAQQEQASCKSAIDEVHDSLVRAQQDSASKLDALRKELSSESESAFSRSQKEATSQLDSVRAQLAASTAAAKKQAAELAKAQAKTKDLESKLKAALEAKVRAASECRGSIWRKPYFDEAPVDEASFCLFALSQAAAPDVSELLSALAKSASVQLAAFVEEVSIIVKVGVAAA